VGLTWVLVFWRTGKSLDRPDIELRIRTCLSYSLAFILTETVRLLFAAQKIILPFWLNLHVYLCFALFSYVKIVSRSFCICFGGMKVYMKNSCKSKFHINIKQVEYVAHIWCKFHVSERHTASVFRRS